MPPAAPGPTASQRPDQNSTERPLALAHAIVFMIVSLCCLQNFGGGIYLPPSLPKQMTIPNASSCTRLLTPSFSLYHFVVSRTSGAEYICPLSSRTARRTNAGPAQAVTPANQSQAGPSCDVYSPQLYYHDCSGSESQVTPQGRHPVGFELATNGIQFYVNLDKSHWTVT